MSDAQRAVFERAFPEGFFVSPDEPDALESYLCRRELFSVHETLRSVGKAGEGNMNLTLRVATSSRSFILKQSRPWVEKYPHIEAPARRAEVEIAFYEAVRSSESLSSRMPQLLGSDASSGILFLEDLGEARDFTSLYRGTVLEAETLSELVDYLVALHSLPESVVAKKRTIFENREMRTLNHMHIFQLPLAGENGLDLDAITEGLSEAAGALKKDGEYCQSVAELGERYLGDGETLLHGDYFPGSWLGTTDGVRIIDTEFCLLGAPAIELGVSLAHLLLAQQPKEICETLVSLYCERAEIRDDDFVSLAERFAGVEIMRRLIGVAQLPLEYGLETKAELLNLSQRMVLQP